MTRVHLVALALLVLPIAASPATVRARVAVLGVGQDAPRPRFLHALELQIAGAADVEQGPRLPEGPLSLRIEAATALVKERDLLVAVWVERDEAQYVVYAVGRLGDRALVKVGRLAAKEVRDADRVLALKVSALIDEIVANSDLSLLGIEREPPPTPARPIAPAPSPMRVGGEIGGVGTLWAGNLGAQRGLIAGGALSFDRSAVSVEAAVLLGLIAADEIDSAQGRLRVGEASIAASGRALVRRGRLGVGGSVDAGARFLSAEAFTSDGVRGSATRTVPTTAIAGDGRWRVRDRLELRASLGVELSWVREQFEVRGEEIGDAGRARARLVIGIVF